MPASRLNKARRGLRRRLVVALCSLTVNLCVPPPVARAEALASWGEDARVSLEDDLESPQLRTLRLLEREWFQPDAAPLPERSPDAYGGDGVYGTPDSFSSIAPAPRPQREPGEVVDLAWLSELELPNIPVRWDDRVVDYLMFFKNDRNGRALMASWLRRSEIYGPMIRRVLKDEGLPSDLQYVAMVESGFDPRARSWVAAQGLWQFMQRSGRHYGLRIDRWVDERLDPEKATRAAARFLGSLYRRFDAWELALASYNMGYGGLLRSLLKFNTNDFWALSHLESGMPYETSLYVSKITAAAIIGNNRDRFGFGDLTYASAEDTVDVEVAPGTYLKPMAIAAGLEPEHLMELNPELLKKRTPPGEETWKVRLPRENLERFTFRWRHREPTVPKHHTVGFGETLEAVARAYGSSPRQLRQLNDLEANEAVYAGEVLLVPGHKAQRDPKPQERPVVTVPAEKFVVPGTRRVFYRVESNDNLDELARFFRVRAADIKAWNALDESADLQSDMLLQLFIAPRLDLGRVIVFTPEEVTLLVAGSEEFFEYHERQRGRTRVRYVCEAGETLQSIGERFDLSPGSIGRINQFSSRHELSAGEQIVVYVPDEQVAALERAGRITTLQDGIEIDPELARDAEEHVHTPEDMPSEATSAPPSP